MTDDSNRGQLLMFLFLMLYFMSSTPPADSGYPPKVDRDHIMKQFHAELKESRLALAGDYKAGYGNLTGFRLSYQDAVVGRNESGWPWHKGFKEDQEYSILPDTVRDAAQEVLGKEAVQVDGGKAGPHGAFHQNLTGVVHGEFSRLSGDLHEMPLAVPAYYEKLREYKRIISEIGDSAEENADATSPFANDGPVVMAGNRDVGRDPGAPRPGNISYAAGSYGVSFKNWDEHRVNNATAMDIIVEVNDPAENIPVQLYLDGVYHRNTGNVIGVTRSAKFAGPYALPHLNLSPGREFNDTRELYLARTNDTQPQFPYVDELLDRSAQCEYIVFLHVESTGLDIDSIRQIDAEMRSPLGRPHLPPPPIKVTGGMVYSPDCGVAFKLGSASGKLHPVQVHSVRWFALCAALLFIIQAWLFIDQMTTSSTPSILARLSFWSICIINLADGSISMIALLMCSSVFKELYLQFVVLAFLAFTCSSIYEMKYNIQIYASQVNERPITWRTAFQGTPIDETENEPTNDDNNNNNNNPTTTTTTPVGPQDEQSIAAQLYTRYFFAMLLLIFLAINAASWPAAPRHFIECLAIFIFNSYWVPQIYRNAIRGSRRSFSWQFMLGTSCLRIVPIAYLFGFSNPFRHRRDYTFVAVIALWLAFQLLLLFLQEIFGPRFFLPDKYMPKTYNYHPLLTKSDLENGYNFESFVGQSPHLKCKMDCAICMQSLEIPVIDSSATNESPESATQSVATSAANLLSARSYMVTPCRHIFHTACLENWMRYKLQCPVCRNSLPPL